MSERPIGWYYGDEYIGESPNELRRYLRRQWGDARYEDVESDLVDEIIPMFGRHLTREYDVIELLFEIDDGQTDLDSLFADYLESRDFAHDVNYIDGLVWEDQRIPKQLRGDAPPTHYRRNRNEKEVTEMAEKIDTEVKKNKKKVKKNELDDAILEDIRRFCAEVKPGEGAEMFDDWNELAPHYMDNVIPGDEDGELEIIGD